jgi:hypothetical protein
MKKLIFLMLSFSLITASEAHSGRTDAYGGHNDYSNGTYHYHNSGGSNSYSGNCACPYDRASDGSLCGARSAWSRSGGASPQCYSNNSSYGNNDGYIDYNFSDAYGVGQLSSYGVGQAAAYQEGYMKGVAIGNAIKIITNNSNSNNQSIPKTRRNKWSCPAGYKRDLADGCIKGFVANLNDGIDAYAEGNYKTAIEHWELLANNGSANAQFYIGRMYEEGVYFPKNDYWAVHWITKAAELGLPDAEYTLGYIYRNGAGVVKDINQTVKWFKKAGKKGHNKAQFNLGAMYINGDGVNKSMKEAKYWINLALNNGHPRAEDVWNDFELSKY